MICEGLCGVDLCYCRSEARVGTFYEWTCAGCQSVMQSKVAPGPDDAKCRKCRAHDAIDDAHEHVKSLAFDLFNARQQVRDRDARIAELEQHIATLQAMVERAHTEPAPSHAPEAAE